MNARLEAVYVITTEPAEWAGGRRERLERHLSESGVAHLMPRGRTPEFYVVSTVCDEENHACTVCAHHYDVMERHCHLRPDAPGAFLVLEDDARFLSGAKDRLDALLRTLARHPDEWTLLYLGAAVSGEVLATPIPGVLRASRWNNAQAVLCNRSARLLPSLQSVGRARWDVERLGTRDYVFGRVDDPCRKERRLGPALLATLRETHRTRGPPAGPEGVLVLWPPVCYQDPAPRTMRNCLATPLTGGTFVDPVGVLRPFWLRFSFVKARYPALLPVLCLFVLTILVAALVLTRRRGRWLRFSGQRSS